MNPLEFTVINNRGISENVKKIAEVMNTGKAEMAIILGVSERTVDNRLSGNIKTSFNIVELLKLAYFWGIPLKEIINPHSTSVSELISDLESEHSAIMSLLKKQIEKKGEIS